MNRLPSRRRYKDCYSDNHIKNEQRKQFLSYQHELCFYLDLSHSSPQYHHIRIKTVSDSSTKEGVIFNSNMSEEERASIIQRFKDVTCYSNDVKHFGELLYILASRYKYDLLSGKPEDNSGFMHTEEIKRLAKPACDEKKKTTLGVSIYATLRKLYKPVPKEKVYVSDFVNMFLFDSLHLYNLVCYVGSTSTTSDSLFWWINVLPDNISFKDVANNRTISNKKLNDALGALFKNSIFNEKTLQIRVSSAEKHLGGMLKGVQVYDPSDDKLPILHNKAEYPEKYFEEKTYLKYRDTSCSFLYSNELVSHLEKRYECEAMKFANSKLPVTILWENKDRLIHPDDILGKFDDRPPKALTSSPTLNTNEYKSARKFITEVFEKDDADEKGDGCEYRMVNIDLNPKNPTPKIAGALGLFYDNILTQYALEWELNWHFKNHKNKDINKIGALPLREGIEGNIDPLIDGSGRCAAMTVSTLLVFRRTDGTFSTTIKKRSSKVGVSRGQYHVAPSGMFEAHGRWNKWSIENNVWRELLEEIYSIRIAERIIYNQDSLQKIEPIGFLIDLLNSGMAEHSVTGICCDLLNLRTEICTILFVKDSRFSGAPVMMPNWEFEKNHSFDDFLIPWNKIDDCQENLFTQGNMVVSGAACLHLGQNWLKARHGI